MTIDTNIRNPFGLNTDSPCTFTGSKKGDLAISKIGFIISLLMFLTILVKAQTPSFEWASQAGGIGWDTGNDVATVGSSHVITVGTFRETVDFDPGSGTSNLTAIGLDDMYIQKLDAVGNLTWVKQIGGTGSNDIVIATSVVTDAQGNLYTTGYFQGTVDFNPGSGSAIYSSTSNQDIFILKLDVNGDFTWLRHMDGSNNDRGNSIALDPSGNVLSTGIFYGTVDFDPGSGVFDLSVSGPGIYVQKLDPSGNLIWAKAMEQGFGEGIACDASGNVLITGSFSGTVDFNPGPTVFNLMAPGGSTNIFVQKLSSFGNFEWAKSMGAPGYADVGNSITSDANDNVYTTGYFKGTADFDPGPGTFNLTSASVVNFSNDIFIQKLNSSGNFEWAKQIGNGYEDIGVSITCDLAGDIYSTGSFRSTVDFDPGSGTVNLSTDDYNPDVYIQKMDGNGNLLWAQQLGGQNHSDVGFGIAVSGNSIFTTGYFSQSSDFDPGAGTYTLSSNGQADAFIHRMSHCVNTPATDTQTACGSLTWIDGNTYTSNNSSATHIIPNQNGCDSIVTLNLTIINVNIGIGLSNQTLTATTTGAAYQWLDCNNNYTPILGQTAQSFTPTQNGSYAVEVTENGCTDTSSCESVTVVGMIANEFNGNVLVYPNPTAGSVAVEFNQEVERLNVYLYSLSGRLVQSEVIDNQHKIEIEIDQPAGIYFLNVTDNEGKNLRVRLVKH